MARIPEAEIERSKDRVSVASLIDAGGAELRRVGKDLVGRCPFHDDSTPSMVVTPAKNLWHCMGACSTGGSVIDWVMRAEGVSFRHAVELVRDGMAPTVLAGAAPARSSVRRLPAPVEQTAADHELLAQVVGYVRARAMTKPPQPSRRLNAEDLLAQPLVWRADPRFRMWLVAQAATGPIFLRINPTFPDEPLYSLLVYEDETIDFDDLPSRWRREGPLSWPDDAR